MVDFQVILISIKIQNIIKYEENQKIIPPVHVCQTDFHLFLLCLNDLYIEAVMPSLLGFFVHDEALASPEGHCFYPC